MKSDPSMKDEKRVHDSARATEPTNQINAVRVSTALIPRSFLDILE
jgi:hypothetical protein